MEKTTKFFGDQGSLEELLKVCHEEPIQTPGSIQPWGTLIAIHAPTGVVHFAAQNTESLLGIPAKELAGQPSEEVLRRELLDAADACLKGEESGVELGRGGDGNDEQFLTAFCVGDYDVLEIEPFVSLDWDWRTYQDMQEELLNLNDPESLVQTAARHTHQLSGYEHIMVYRFHENWDGEVVAEVAGGSLPSYAGHRFPASDIPKQARKLYKETQFRIIPDVHYEPIPLLGVVEEPLRLGPSWLRSVSPIHLQYLKNMGVGASMSISIMVDEQLWGLIACHHPTPRSLPPYGRRAATLYGRQLSNHLSFRQKESIQTYVRAHRKTFRLPHQFVAENTSLTNHLTDHGTELLDLTASEGCALYLFGHLEILGRVPNEESTLELVQWLTQYGIDSLWQTDHLAAHYDGATNIQSTGSGVLALRLPGEEDHFVVWFRPEVIETVTWAGNPNRPAVRDEESPLGLSPRNSFSSWEEQVRGHARSWSSEHIAAAQEFRGHLLEAMVTETTRQRNEQLDVIHQILRHDVRNSATALRLLTDILREEVGEEFQGLTDRLVNASHEVANLTLSIGALSEAIRQPANSSVQTIDLRAMIKQEVNHASNLYKHASIDFQPTPSDGDFFIEALPLLSSVFRNLIGNAVVHNDKNEPQVEVKLNRSDSSIQVEISDNGPGIPEDLQEKIFQKGYSAPGGGTGIGLYLVQVIVDQSGGEVEVSNNTLGGTVITVLFPCS